MTLILCQILHHFQKIVYEKQESNHVYIYIYISFKNVDFLSFRCIDSISFFPYFIYKEYFKFYSLF